MPPGAKSQKTDNSRPLYSTLVRKVASPSCPSRSRRENRYGIPARFLGRAPAAWVLAVTIAKQLMMRYPSS